MRFRPCIDIHNGAVKQIVGSSLRDENHLATDNFVSEQDGAYYGALYKKDGLKGGHIILLNPVGTKEYELDKKQAVLALQSYPEGLQIGGGVSTDNAEEFLDMGASHVIVTSFVFRDGKIDMERLRQLKALIGKDRLVLDLSCRFVKDAYYIVTDRWQKVTKVPFNAETLYELSQYCDEFLVHAVDVEGKASGIEKEVVACLAKNPICPVTYAGGIHSMQDILYIEETGKGYVDFTVGSALDLFGGSISYADLAQHTKTNLWK